MSILIPARPTEFCVIRRNEFLGGRVLQVWSTRRRRRRRRRRPPPPPPPVRPPVYVTQTIRPVCFGTYRGIPKNSFAVFPGGMYQSIRKLIARGMYRSNASRARNVHPPSSVRPRLRRVNSRFRFFRSALGSVYARASELIDEHGALIRRPSINMTTGQTEMQAMIALAGDVLDLLYVIR